MTALRQSQAGQQDKQETGTHAQHPRCGGGERKGSVRDTGHGLKIRLRGSKVEFILSSRDRIRVQKKDFQRLSRLAATLTSSNERCQGSRRAIIRKPKYTSRPVFFLNESRATEKRETCSSILPLPLHTRSFRLKYSAAVRCSAASRCGLNGISRRVFASTAINNEAVSAANDPPAG